MTFLLRRQIAAGAALLAAFGLGAPALAQNPQPIKVGLMSIDSGPFTFHGKLIEQGVKAIVEILNSEGGIEGRKLEIVQQSNSGSPAAAVAAATKLAQQGGVSVITGQLLSSHSMAISPKLEQLNALLIDGYAQANDLMTRSCSPNYFRVNTPDAATTRMMQDFVKASKAQTWNLISADYAAGRSFADSFSQLVVGLGGKVNENLFSPMGTSDFGSFISQLGKPADALVVSLFMSDGASFAKQSHQFGLFDKYKMVIGNGFATDFQLEQHGDNVLGVINTLSYSADLPGERNQWFVREFERRTGRKPLYNDSDIMSGLELYRAAVIKAKSTETAAVRKAMEGMKAPTVLGDIEMRAADHTAIRPHGMAQVVRAPNGKTTFKMITYRPGSEIYPPPSPECKVS
ncbi:ABC transporter substrate-binding protein [Variovorax paradoxus]|nr:ABC transporter substrate-binding protein [Variovorax paradoxus]MBT2301889.1 ABC transporter substrate-binding protein [Variovorax paradoxus]